MGLTIVGILKIRFKSIGRPDCRKEFERDVMLEIRKMGDPEMMWPSDSITY